MRNRYLEWADSVEPWRRQAQENDRSESAKIIHAESIELIAAEWWQQERLQQSPDERKEPVWPDLLCTAVPIGIRRGIVDLLRDDATESNVPNAVQRLAGRALARSLAMTRPDLPSLNSEYRRRQARYEFYQAFEAAFIKLLQAAPRQREAWIASLLRPMTFMPIPGSPEQTSINQGTVIAQLQQAWQETTDPFFIWRRSQQRMESNPDALGFLWGWTRLLLALDLQGWLCGVNALPLPFLMRAAVFEQTIREDGELIQELLRAAPPMFRMDGRWNRSVLVLLLLDVALDHAERVYAAVAHKVHFFSRNDRDSIASRAEAESQRDAAERDLAAWLRDIYSVLLAREDGRLIAIRLQAKLIRQLLTGTPRIAAGWSQRQALHNLTGAMARVSLSVNEIYRVWQGLEQTDPATRDLDWPVGEPADAEGEGARSLHAVGLPLLLGASELTEVRRTTAENLPAQRQSEQDLLWSWLLDLLQGHDLGLVIIAPEPRVDKSGLWFQWAYNKLAFILEGRADVWQAIEQGIRVLEPQRRRLRFHQPSLWHTWKVGGTEILCRAGQYLCARRISAEHGVPCEVRALFLRIFASLHQLYLTAPLARWHVRSETIREILTDSFAFAPSIFKEDLFKALEVMVPVISEDARLVHQAHQLCVANCPSPSSVTEMFIRLGTDPSRAARESNIWEPDPDSLRRARMNIDKNKSQES